MLYQTMLEEFKDIIFNKSGLPDTVKEPVHVAVKVIVSLEYSYEDFLSREISGTNKRADIIRDLILLHGGDITEFDAWFEQYEGTTENAKSSGSLAAWGS